MTCAERDQDLLMLAHDALPWGQRLLTQWHLRGCARCRTKLSEFGTVSRALAWTISGRVPHGAYGMSPAQDSRKGHPVTSLLVTGLVLIVVAEATVLVVRRALGLTAPPPAAIVLPQTAPAQTYPTVHPYPGQIPAQCPFHSVPSSPTQARDLCAARIALPKHPASDPATTPTPPSVRQSQK